MRGLSTCAALAAGALLLTSVFADPLVGAAQAMPQLHAVHCPHFTATPWVNPDSQATGNGYGMILTNTTITCPQATALAKGLMARNNAGSSAAYAPTEVGGGPAGYHCYLTPDGHGHWLGGTCQKRSAAGQLLAALDWLALGAG
jgi:hypothetical protein